MLFPMVCSAMDEVFSIFRQEETLRIQRETKRSTTLMRTGQSSEAPMVHRSANTVSEHH
jgi:hypothetical protein